MVVILHFLLLLLVLPPSRAMSGRREAITAKAWMRGAGERVMERRLMLVQGLQGELGVGRRMGLGWEREEPVKEEEEEQREEEKELRLLLLPTARRAR